MPIRQAIAIFALVVGASLPACAQPKQAEAAKPGQATVYLDNAKIDQLSGITRLGKDRYLVVSDKQGLAAEATIKINPDTGLISYAALGEMLTIEGGRDLEDIAYDPAEKALIVVDEASQTVTRHSLNGSKAGSFDVPKVFKTARPNLGFESLAITPDGEHIWTANEEALKGDGPRSDGESGTLIRLQRFDAAGRPAAQYGYLTDAHRGADNILKRAQCGVSGLVALADGSLVVMERELGGKPIPTFRIRLYLVRPGSRQPGESPLQRVEKRLLKEIDAGLANYEGITPGPTLNDGDLTFLLVADDGGGRTNPQALRVVRISADSLDAQAQP